jgi:hypothetical protein
VRAARRGVRDDVERERDVLLDGAAREQLEVLEHDADPAAQLGHRARREPRRVAPSTTIWPSLGRSAANTSRKSDVLPRPDGPVRNTNSPRLNSSETSRSA